MRRSKSSSNIPIPRPSIAKSCEKRDADFLNRPGPSQERRREPSAESLRTPQVVQAKFTFGSTLKVPQQTAFGQLFTPTSTPHSVGSSARRNRSRSVSSFGSRISTIRNKSPGERALLLTKDKKWVAEQFSKIQEFIQTSGLYNPELANKIRPPTMAIFVELISKLLEKLIKTVPINIQNCHEVVLNTLKVLNYPGQLTITTLKSVNNTYGWPQFVTIISWLIDRVELEKAQEMFKSQLDQESQNVIDKKDAVFDFFASLYVLQKKDAATIEEEVPRIEDNLYEDMLQITGAHSNLAVQIDETLKREREKFNKIDESLKKIVAENEQLEAQNKERQDVIDKYKESGCNREQEVEKERQQLKKAYSKAIATKTHLSLSVKKLQNLIAKQPIKLKDKNILLNQIEEQKRLNKRNEQLHEEFKAMRSDLDVNLGQLIIKIESKVDQWNVAVTKCYLPELKDMRLRAKGFASASSEFLMEVEAIQKRKENLLDKLLEEFQVGQEDLKRLRKSKESLKERAKSIELSRQKLLDLKAEVDSVKEVNEKKLAELEEGKKNHAARLKAIVEEREAEVKKRKAIIEQLRFEEQRLAKEIEKDSKWFLAFVIKAHNEIIENLHKLTDEVLLIEKGLFTNERLLAVP